MTGYRVTPHARRHVAEIFDYSIGAWGKRRADQYLLAIMNTIEAVAGKRRHARPCDEYGSGMRSVISGSHTIYLRYDTRSNMYDVIGVLHQSMDPSRHLPANDEQE